MPSLRRVPLDQIDEPARAARTQMDDARLSELATSLAIEGLLQPIILHRILGRLQVHNGHRRYLAARSLGWPYIDAIVYEENEPRPRSGMLAENVIREDMNPLDEARELNELMDREHLTPAAACRRTGKSRSWVDARLMLLVADDVIQASVQAEEIGAGVAALLMTIPDPAWRAYYLHHAEIEGANLDRVKGWAAQCIADLRRQEAAGEPPRAPSLLDPPPEPLWPCYLCHAPRAVSQLQARHVCLDCLRAVAAAVAASDERKEEPAPHD